MSKAVFAESVPCNGCTACCKRDLIILQPECGDDASQYITVDVVNPITGKPAKALDRKPNLDCIYLGEGGCTIHGSAPAICREFDCRRSFLMLGNREQRRALIQKGLISKDVTEAGRKRLHTLPGFER